MNLKNKIQRTVSKKAFNRFKWTTICFCFSLLSYAIIGQTIDETEWDHLDDRSQTIFDRGIIVEFADDSDFCHSYVVIPGLPLVSKAILTIGYLLCLVYLFLGISIISDIFMGAIEEITSQTRTVTYQDENGNERETEISVWNPTIANLTLMALGSSAPEILLACIETISDLGGTPGELGPSTIVGSAAFNLLAISAVCVASVPTGTVKKIKDTFVFGVTSITSLLAYVWLFIVLEVWSEGEIEIAEAVITFCFFPIFIACAFIADKINEKREKEEEKNKKIKQRSLPMKEFFHVLGAKSTEEAKIRKEDGTSKVKASKLNDFFKQNFGTQELTSENLEKIREKFKPTDPIQQRIYYRRNIGKIFRGLDRQVVKKNEIIFNEIRQAEKEKPEGLNPIVGFRCLHYSVSEGIGKIKVKILNKTSSSQTQDLGKVPPPLEVGVRTVDFTANAGSDYVKIDKVITFAPEDIEQTVDVEIINDDKFEPDEDFFIELYDPETMQTLEGLDCKTKVTIIDDDQPGKLGFSTRITKTRGKDKAAKLKILRQAGTDGEVTVKFKTVEMQGISCPAIPGEDYMAVSGTVSFEQGENEKEIIIPILDRDSIEERADQFEVELYEPTNGAKLGKKFKTTVEIVGNNEILMKAKGVEEIINNIRKKGNTQRWRDQFKLACMLSPQVDENGVIDDITTIEALTHFAAIGWKVLFALVPPAHYWRGWPAFFVSLFFIGAVTAIVGEFAALLGCVINLKQSLTAISIVALGTSLPDTFASRQAALESDNADVAIGNITGSNSVNVFLGLGLPWLIGSLYYEAEPGVFLVSKEGLSFSVMMYIIVSSLCLITLVVRRFAVGGELGGEKGLWKWLTAAWFIFLWVIYLVFSGLRAYDAI